MSQSFLPDEPTPDYLADTGPVQPIRDVPPARRAASWQRAVGLFSLLGATLLTIAAVVVMLEPNEPGDPPLPVVLNVTDSAEDDAAPTATPLAETPADSPTSAPILSVDALPTLDPARFGALLSQPAVETTGLSAAVDFEEIRNIHNPFTIIPERTRSGVENYTIETGDTIFAIAERYGLEPETIVWGNDHSIVEGLRPGKVINILPVNGVYHQVMKGDTVATIATKYRVDPYAILDSDFNDLFGVSPDDPLPEGTWVVVPGGEREQISWNPVVQRVEAGSSGSAQGAISFAVGEPGSCGLVTNPGGTGWARPLAGYQWVRGFSGVHSGVDLSAPVGTPVYAANGGSVIFAGWNSYGYGYTVVLAHGPFTTLYGHLNSFSVGCAQYVSAGQPIGTVGSSGNSSGPHLHFEIRYMDIPQDPTYTLPF